MATGLPRPSLKIHGATPTHLLAFIGILVRVVFQREFPVGLFEFVLGGLGVHTQQIVVGCFVYHGVNLANAQKYTLA